MAFGMQLVEPRRVTLGSCGRSFSAVAFPVGVESSSSLQGTAGG